MNRLYPAIPDGRTWSKLGKHGEQRERGEHGKDGKHQPDGLKDSIFDSKYSNCDSKHFFWQSDDSKHFTLRLLTVEKIITYAQGDITPGFLKMGEHQAKCRALIFNLSKLVASL